jgi:hypothetical protein
VNTTPVLVSVQVRDLIRDALHAALQSRTLWWIQCADCGDGNNVVLDEDYVDVYDTAAEAATAVLRGEDGFTVGTDRRVLCERYSEHTGPRQGDGDGVTRYDLGAAFVSCPSQLALDRTIQGGADGCRQQDRMD